MWKCLNVDTLLACFIIGMFSSPVQLIAKLINLVSSETVRTVFTARYGLRTKIKVTLALLRLIAEGLVQ